MEKQKKTIKNPSLDSILILIVFLLIVERFWDEFQEGFRSQTALKQQNQFRKNYTEFCNDFATTFQWILAPFWTPRGGPRPPFGDPLALKSVPEFPQGGPGAQID